MHVTRPPPPEPPLNRPDPPPPRLAAAAAIIGERVASGGTATELAPNVVETAIPVASLADQVHIQPLDIKGAMQILIAEVRAELPLPGDAPSSGAAQVLNPATVPPALVLEFLQALPDAATQEPAAWMASASHVTTAILAALDKGLATVSAWHDVPPSVVDAAHEVRALVVGALLDDPPNALWLRPEWLGLAPRMERFRRRRRYARRRLSDPDPGAARFEDSRVRDDEDWDPPPALT